MLDKPKGGEDMQWGNELERKVETALLFAFYGPLLTAKQQEILRLTFEEDMSLSEIATEQRISRQGVHEQLRRAIKQLNSLEEKIHMVKRFSDVNNGLEQALSALESGKADEAAAIIAALKERNEEEENGL